MIKTLSTNEMINELLADQFDWTYDEAEALVNFYEELEDQLDEVIEFDPVAMHCEWTSATEEEVREMYSIEGDVKEYLKDRVFLEVEDKLLFLNF
jgi:phosphopantetheine adenylyltransferase